MPVVNGRKKNMCVLCREWLGDEPDYNPVTGNCKFEATEQLCALDGKEHSPADICRSFNKNVVYM